MYKCQECKVVQEANTPSAKVTKEARRKNYVNKITRDRVDTFKESSGWEIAKEAIVCPMCAQVPTTPKFVE